MSHFVVSFVTQPGLKKITYQLEMCCRKGGHENENKMHFLVVKKTERSYSLDAANKAGWDLTKIGLEVTRKISQIINDDIWLSLYFGFILC